MRICPKGAEKFVQQANWSYDVLNEETWHVPPQKSLSRASQIAKKLAMRPE